MMKRFSPRKQGTSCKDENLDISAITWKTLKKQFFYDFQCLKFYCFQSFSQEQLINDICESLDLLGIKHFKDLYTIDNLESDQKFNQEAVWLIVGFEYFADEIEQKLDQISCQKVVQKMVEIEHQQNQVQNKTFKPRSEKLIESYMRNTKHKQLYDQNMKPIILQYQDYQDLEFTQKVIKKLDIGALFSNQGLSHSKNIIFLDSQSIQKKRKIIWLIYFDIPLLQFYCMLQSIEDFEQIRMSIKLHKITSKLIIKLNKQLDRSLMCTESVIMNQYEFKEFMIQQKLKGCTNCQIHVQFKDLKESISDIFLMVVKNQQYFVNFDFYDDTIKSKYNMIVLEQRKPQVYEQFKVKCQMEFKNIKWKIDTFNCRGANFEKVEYSQDPDLLKIFWRNTKIANTQDLVLHKVTNIIIFKDSYHKDPRKLQKVLQNQEIYGKMIINKTGQKALQSKYLQDSYQNYKKIKLNTYYNIQFLDEKIYGMQDIKEQN